MRDNQTILHYAPVGTSATITTTPSTTTITSTAVSGNNSSTITTSNNKTTTGTRLSSGTPTPTPDSNLGVGSGANTQVLTQTYRPPKVSRLWLRSRSYVCIFSWSVMLSPLLLVVERAPSQWRFSWSTNPLKILLAMTNLLWLYCVTFKFYFFLSFLYTFIIFVSMFSILFLLVC